MTLSLCILGKFEFEFEKRGGELKIGSARHLFESW